ncbi:hypothetical protein BKA08_002249 [Nocardioides marinisabuli]|uniref:N-acetyltransferase domain-containing protein n=1 Tax=Nocardioides marinisabuli TaxID=419476 RepID=A0A7Y9JR90_9ACTN|nr:hypothetical protein [Nocardioides marinisabuli]NYD58011.1 hypothetical protein [Nocardioides marinisabuli]
MPERTLEGLTVTIEVETVLEPEVVERFHALYAATFEPLATRAVARQVLHREEFVEEMSDPRVMKYVARDLDGEVVGLTTLTRDLETVPWISPDYFAAHYPEHTARDAVYYLGFTLVAPQHRRTHVFQSMIEEVVELVRDDRGVCGWDVCAYNEQHLGFSTMIGALLHSRADCTIEQVDTQTYSVVQMHGPRGS